MTEQQVEELNLTLARKKDLLGFKEKLQNEVKMGTAIVKIGSGAYELDKQAREAIIGTLDILIESYSKKIEAA